MKIQKLNKIRFFIAMFLVALTYCGFAYADAGVTQQDEQSAKAAPAAASADTQDHQALGQFPQAEIAPASPEKSQNASLDFPKVKTSEDEALAKKFAWWPTDAKPAPVKDPDRSGYWWWPQTPGQTRPWGN